VAVICVLAVAWAGGDAESAGRLLLEAGIAPRVAVEEGRLWVDAGGLSGERVAAEVGRVLAAVPGARCGVADSPVAAYAAAVTAEDGRPARVAEGADRAFLEPLPLGVLEPEERLSTLLEGVGVESCGDLAALPREAVEARFGGEAVETWRRARAEDRRRLFRPIAPERPHASLEFVDYVVTSPEQLLFTANALLANLCAGLAERGEHARAMRLDLPLANGECWTRVLRPARPTASRAVWLRLIRTQFERLTVADAVAGVALGIEATEAAAAVQGDLFDPGFATSGAVEAALARLLETQGPVMVRAAVGEHPLPERRTEFQPVAIEALVRAEPADTPQTESAPAAASGLTLQLLPDPRAVLVESVCRRDHVIPVRYRDGRWRQFATVAGPDRISGGSWEQPYAREYYRGVTGEGSLVLLYRDARNDAWFLHGWWD
jgi:protein ImuB